MEDERLVNSEPKNDIDAAPAQEPVNEPAPPEWTAIKRQPKPEVKIEQRELPEVVDIPPEKAATAEAEEAPAEGKQDSPVETPDEPKVTVAEVEEIEPIETYSADTAAMAKQAKKAGKEARREAKRNTEIYEAEQSSAERADDGSILKSKSFRDIWEKICLALLIVAIGVPVALLVYIIMNYFL